MSMISRNILSIKTLLLLGIVTIGPGAWAQEEDWEEIGEIEDGQVIIEKDRKIELPVANRTYEKVPPSEINKNVKPQQYDFSENLYRGSAYLPSLRTQRIESGNRANVTNNLVKLGFGNYVSPLAQVSLNTVQNKLTAGLNFKHLSFARGPVGGSNSESSDNTGGIFVNLTNKKSALSLDLDFESLKRYHYGFSEGFRSSIDPTKQKYNTFGANLEFNNSDSESPLDYRLKTGFYTMTDNFNAKENGFSVLMALSVPIIDNVTLFSESKLLLTGYEDITDINRNLINVRGGIGYDLGQLSITAAANIVLANDTISNSNDFKPYPYITANYKITDQWSLDGGLTGDLEAVTLKSIVNENPFISQNIPLVHTNKQIEVYGRINGQLGERIDLNTGISFANYENLYFYTDTLRFNLVYEPDATNVFNLFTSVNYNHQNAFSVNTRIDYFNYSTKVLPEVWHRPNFTAHVSFRYNLNKKLNLASFLSVLSGIKSFNPETVSTIKLKPILDLGIDVNYQINDKFNAFIEIDNVLSKKYERYIHYLNRSFMTHLGVTYSF